MYDKVGRLQVLDKWKQDGRDYALTLCNCGNKKAMRYDYIQKCVKENLEASCGCRQKEHARDLGFKNKKFNYNRRKLQDCWKHITRKVKFRVEIIAKNLTNAEAKLKEIEFIHRYRSYGLVMANIGSGGEGPSGFRHTDEWIQNKKKQMKGNSYAKGKPYPPLSKSHKDQISARHKGKIVSQDTKNLLSKPIYSYTDDFIYPNKTIAAQILEIPKSRIGKSLSYRKPICNMQFSYL